MLVNPHPLNALIPILVNESGRLIVCNELHTSANCREIETVFAPNTILINEGQL